jgi:hypothetical protein
LLDSEASFLNITTTKTASVSQVFLAKAKGVVIIIIRVSEVQFAKDQALECVSKQPKESEVAFLV